jgi:hypothetical protein
MVFGLGDKRIKELRKKLENLILQERETLVDIFISAKKDLIADNKITIQKGIEEAKQELRESVNVKAENAFYEKTKQYEEKLQKITDNCLEDLKKNADNYFSAVLTQYQIMLDESKKAVNEMSSAIEKSNQSYKNIENKIEELKKTLKTEDIEKVLGYKAEIDSRLLEIKSFYEEKDKQYAETVSSLKITIKKIEEEYISQQKRLENQITELNNLMSTKK